MRRQIIPTSSTESVRWHAPRSAVVALSKRTTSSLLFCSVNASHVSTHAKDSFVSCSDMHSCVTALGTHARHPSMNRG